MPSEVKLSSVYLSCLITAVYSIHDFLGGFFFSSDPVHLIASNAGVEGAVVVGKLLEQDNTDLGYDAAKGEYVDMIKAGIVDPLKVIRTALVDAASVSSLMTTTEAVVVELPKEENISASAMGGGMGGMGGMDY
ncbi:hypothetical protein IFM89_019644 [Coptis chinensis]|uniref:Heat shock protein 60 n=1 Tax=Coptis chinensis TaxID=261450 RepID=A0A835I3N3_9MAGN|nr:hypothetical protein IFM89_019644 [Coptis chinensis]